MARITKKRTVGNAAPVVTGLAAGLPLLAFGPVGLLAGFLVGFIGAKKGIAEEMEEEGAGEDAEYITDKWLNNRFVGEREISITREKPMGGILPIPMSVTHTTRLFDFEETDAAHTDSLVELDKLRLGASTGPRVHDEIRQRMSEILESHGDIVALARECSRMSPCSAMRDQAEYRLRELIAEEGSIVTLLHAGDALFKSPSLSSAIKSRIKSLTDD